jgi:putative effector of murein hydrolase
MALLACQVAGEIVARRRWRWWRARGFAAGVASHGIGTAQAFQVNEVAGTFAGIAMALNGIATAIMAPLLISLLA